jgi:hypothetical protein
LEFFSPPVLKYLYISFNKIGSIFWASARIGGC